MKRFLLSFLVLAVSVATASAQIVKPSERPSDKEFRKAVKTIMYKTNGHDLDEKRMEDAE